MALTIVERAVTPTTVKPGMLAYITYSGKNYTIFVINPNKPNIHTNSVQLHAYSLGGQINESDFINILVNLNADLVIDTANKEIRTGALNDSEAYEAKYVLGSIDSRPYRTFNVKQLGSMRQLFIALPSEIDNLLSGEVTITNKSSKRKLLTCAQSGDIKCIKEIPEIKEILNISVSKTEQQVEQEEAAEREKVQQTRKRPIQQVLRNTK